MLKAVHNFLIETRTEQYSLQTRKEQHMMTPTTTTESVRFPRVTLVESASSGYLHLAAEVDRGLPFLPNSRKKRELVATCKRWCEQLETDPGVLGAVLFDAFLIPPGRGEFVKERPEEVHIARFDLSILVETVSLEVAEVVKLSPTYAEMERAVKEAATFTHAVTASNVRRIGPVDHSRQGVFLFNYFFAADTAQNVETWEDTAGWWEQETGLDNSTVLLPSGDSKYNLINHCRWDSLGDVMPSIVFKPSFRSFVLANFKKSSVAAMPILYRLA